MATPSELRSDIETFLQCLKVALQRGVDPKIKALRESFDIEAELIGELVEIEVLEPAADQSYEWITDKAIPAIVDQLFDRKRRAEDEKRFKALEARVASVESTVIEAAKVFQAVSQEIAGINESLNAQAELLKKVDPETLELATMYAAESQEKLRAVSNAIERIASIVLATSPGELEVMVSDFKSKTPAPTKTAKKDRTKIRIGIVGIYERDLRHVEDKINGLEVAQRFNVKLELLDHLVLPFNCPKGLDAVFVGDHGHKRYPEVKSLYGDRGFRWTGGFSSCAQSVEQFLKTLL